MTQSPGTLELAPAEQRRGVLIETLIVLGLSLGMSAVYSVLQIIDKLTVHVALNQQTTSLNNSVTPDRPWLDLAYQLVGIGAALMPVPLVLHLLRGIWPPRAGLTSAAHYLGFDWRRPGFDLGVGMVLAACIGIPGLGLYVVAKALGFNTQVAAANLTGAWWTIPVLLLAAWQNGALEEVVMIGYLTTRLRQARWGWWWAIGASALVRGSYHLYQGFGGFLGNAVMGVMMGLVYKRWARVGPLVVAHTILDIVSFVGYTLLKDKLGFLH